MLIIVQQKRSKKFLQKKFLTSSLNEKKPSKTLAENSNKNSKK